MYEDCSCVQGIEHFLDPRPYLPQYESPNNYVINIPPWMHLTSECGCGAPECSTSDSNEDTSTSTTTNDNSSSKDLRTAFLYVTGNTIINSGYLYMVAYQVRSAYVYVKSDDSTWINGNLSLIMQNIDSDVQEVVPIELNKYIKIPDTVLTPGTLNISATCMAKDLSSEYTSILTESVSIKVNDPGIKQVDWPTKPAYDIYYNYQVTANNISKGITSINNNIVGLQYDIINLQKENASLKSAIEDLKIRINKLEE